MTDLPTKILELLTRALLPSQHDRLSLALCCRRFYDIVLPILYSSPCLRADRKSRRKFVYSFVERILEKPSLANAVGKLELHRWDIVPDATRHEELLPEVLEAAQACKLPEDEHTKWVIDIRAGKTDAWLALILPKLQNLHSVWILFPPSTKCPNYVIRMLDRAAGREPPFDTDQPAFPLLTEVYFTSADLSGPNPELLLPFLSFDSVHTLGGNRIGSRYGKLRPRAQREALAPNPNRTPTSNTTTLDLRVIGFYGGLNRWVENCKALKSFHMTCSSFFDRENSHPAHPSLGNPSSLLPALEMHKSTLLSVLIDAHDEDAQERYMNTDYERLHDAERGHEDCGWIRERKGCFADFAVLKSLHVLLPSLVGYIPPVDHERNPFKPGPVLVLTDCIPPSIEELHLATVYNDLPWLASQLIGLLTDRERHAPNLHRMVLEGTPWAGSSQPPDQVCAAFQHAGVELVVMERPRGKFFGPSWEGLGLQYDPQRR